jgi:hypothetical protein
MAVDEDPGSRAVEAARRAAQLRLRPEHDATAPFTHRDVEETDRSVEAARFSAAQAARSAAQSLDRSAAMHARVADVEEETVKRIPTGTERQEESATFHRRSAEQDRRYAEQKRDEAAADEIPG